MRGKGWSKKIMEKKNNKGAYIFPPKHPFLVVIILKISGILPSSYNGWDVKELCWDWEKWATELYTFVSKESLPSWDFYCIPMLGPFLIECGHEWGLAGCCWIELMALERILFQVCIWPKQCLFCQIEFFFETLSFLSTLNKGEPYTRPSEASSITWVLEPSLVQIASKWKGFRELKTSLFVLRIIGFWFDEVVGKWCTEALGRCFFTHHLRKLYQDTLWCLQYYVFFIWPCKWIALRNFGLWDHGDWQVSFNHWYM